MASHSVITKVQHLRSSGKTYNEIRAILKQKIPKSTLSYWCRNVLLPQNYSLKIERVIKNGAQRGRAIALIVNKEKRRKYLENLDKLNSQLLKLLRNEAVAKLVLAILFWTEGSKKTKGSLMLGNSDPSIIMLFLKLLRFCYKVDEKKLRCTLQCRADQNTEDLEQFWSKITNIPPDQFYKANIDPRTIDRPSKKPEYKGVCRINYFSAHIHNDLKSVCRLISLNN